VAEGTENAVLDETELLSAMEELHRAQLRVDQLLEQNRQKAIAEVMEKIKMYDLHPEELGFKKSVVVAKAGRRSAVQQPLPQTPISRGGVSASPEVTNVGRDRRSEVQPKYRSPDGTETWSGRGKAPKWMQNLLDAGNRKEDYEIARSDSGSAD
jgi:DNA-binding protein H-NS